MREKVKRKKKSKRKKQKWKCQQIEKWRIWRRALQLWTRRRRRRRRPKQAAAFFNFLSALTRRKNKKGSAIAYETGPTGLGARLFNTISILRTKLSAMTSSIGAENHNASERRSRTKIKKKTTRNTRKRHCEPRGAPFFVRHFRCS